jgi:YidC/Oxa1 family membrane protein insertase
MFMQEQQKNLIIALLVCVVVWLGVETWLKPASPVSEKNTPQTTVCIPKKGPLSLKNKQTALGPHIKIENAAIKGAISLKGAVVDQWVLKGFHETLEKDSPPVTLLTPECPSYAAFFKWYTSQETQGEVPTEETLWQADGTVLEPSKPLTLHWRNARGVLFQLVFEIDDAYMLTVKQNVSNTSRSPIEIGTQGVIDRQGPVQTSGYMMLYEGPLGVFSGQLKEKTYDETQKEGSGSWMTLGETKGNAGWLGITDKYWLSALIPAHSSKGRFVGMDSPLFYQAESTTLLESVGPGQTHTCVTHLFAGPKQLSLLESYEKKLGICHFDLAVDFGWFYFLTKPMFKLLSGLKNLLGSFGLAILGMTVLMRLLFFPLSLKSYRAMARMKKVAPQLQAIKDKYGDDKVKLNQEIIAFYRKEKINPASGCLPMIMQMPVFFSLYKVLFVSIEMRQAPFWGWIQDLSAPDPTSIFNAFGLLPWVLPSWLHIGLWPLLMGLTMILQQKMNTSMTLDRQQQIMFGYVMPMVFTVMLAQFPVGLVIYWTWTNTLMILQQWLMMRYYKVD